MAASGMTLGLVGVLLWVFAGTGLGLFVRYIMTEKDQAEKTVQAFLQDLADGKIDEAMARTVPGVDRKPMIAIGDRTKTWGPLSYLRVDSSPTQAEPTAENSLRFRWQVAGKAIFSRGSPEISAAVIKDGEVYKVERFEMR